MNVGALAFLTAVTILILHKYYLFKRKRRINERRGSLDWKMVISL